MHDYAETAEVRPGDELDWHAFGSYLQTELAMNDGELKVLQFPNGAANLTYLIRVGNEHLVLRRPPFGRIASGAHDMAREYRVLSRLCEKFPAAPRPIVYCEDESIVGSVFLLIEFRSGVVIRNRIPEPLADHADVARRIGISTVQALADLHRIDHVSCGLSDLGRPDGYLTRQIRGWRDRWRAVDIDGETPVILEVSEILERTQPRSQSVAIVHNDFKLDNCQFRPDDPDRVHSVFDWDMATLGDPLVDLGLLLNYWPDPSDSSLDRGVYHEGMEKLGLPTHADLIQEYATASSFELSEIAWYHSFATWKTAIVLQQLYDRYRRGETNDQRMASAGQHAWRT